MYTLCVVGALCYLRDSNDMVLSDLLVRSCSNSTLASDNREFLAKSQRLKIYRTK